MLALPCEIWSDRLSRPGYACQVLLKSVRVWQTQIKKYVGTFSETGCICCSLIYSITKPTQNRFIQLDVDLSTIASNFPVTYDIVQVKHSGLTHRPTRPDLNLSSRWRVSNYVRRLSCIFTLRWVLKFDPTVPIIYSCPPVVQNRFKLQPQTTLKCTGKGRLADKMQIYVMRRFGV